MLTSARCIVQSRAEASMAIDHLWWFAEEAKRAYGRIIPNWADHRRNLVVKSPWTVAAAKLHVATAVKRWLVPS